MLSRVYADLSLVYKILLGFQYNIFLVIFSFVGFVIWGERGKETEVVNLDQDGEETIKVFSFYKKIDLRNWDSVARWRQILFGDDEFQAIIT